MGLIVVGGLPVEGLTGASMGWFAFSRGLRNMSACYHDPQRQKGILGLPLDSMTLSIATGREHYRWSMSYQIMWKSLKSTRDGCTQISPRISSEEDMARDFEAIKSRGRLALSRATMASRPDWEVVW